jgi:hypothetical protein
MKFLHKLAAHAAYVPRSDAAFQKEGQKLAAIQNAAATAKEEQK